MKIGVVLLNLGTPDDLKIGSIRRYLREFLLDPRVIDLNPFARYLLVYMAILPFRPQKTLKAYKEIWQAKGSPLRIHMEELTQALSHSLGEAYQVVMGMRYGNPSIELAFNSVRSCEHILIFPLFPQYSSAATGSAIEEFMRVASKNWNISNLNILNSFYAEEGFINASANMIKPHLKNSDSFLLLSYHGLPERHLSKSLCTAPCDKATPCPKMNTKNTFCYRAQCYETSRLIAKQLQLKPESFMSTFQSRLGRTPWIKPYTDEELTKLRAKNILNLVVVCPSFVSDCLETLEEIGIQAKNQWLKLGGKSFTLVPCLNDNEDWVNALKEMVKNNTPQGSTTDECP